MKTKTPPMVNQIEVLPRLTHKHLRRFYYEHNIPVTSWSPLARGGLLSEPRLQHIGNKYGETAAQVIIRWYLQSDLIVIPKSVKPERVSENINVADFELALSDKQAIDALNLNERLGSNPENF